jgi:Restriction endonuclease
LICSIMSGIGGNGMSEVTEGVLFDAGGSGQEAAASDAVALAKQRSRWMRQLSAAPNIQCGKDQMFPLTLELIRKISDGEAVDLDARPVLSHGGSSRSWRDYLHPLRTMGLVQTPKGAVHLTADGAELLADGSRSHLASLMADRIRLFAETLGLLVREPLTIEEVNSELVESYSLDWKTVTNARVRMTWLEVLGLIEWLGGRKQSATPEGRKLFSTWEIVTPAALAVQGASEAADIPEAPGEIAALLDRLSMTTGAQDARNTYNIWVPSPKSDPNKIENMRTIITAATDPIEKEDLLVFIASRFGLKRSSVESMMPFMRAAGLLREVRRGIFVATPAAKAWLQSESDIDFIRILHGNMRFIGELIYAAKTNISRDDLYREGVRHGLNKEKVRWLTSFLVESGLVVETSWSSIQATPTGMRFIETLPLAEPRTQTPDADTATVQATVQQAPKERSEVTQVAESLIRTSTDPSADGKTSGAAFEICIERAFQHMGFQAQRISGSGDTDVLVQWYDGDGSLRTAIVDGKSTASGHVTHTSVSDVAINAHKDKNTAEFVAIVAPSFSGDTIRNAAQKQEWVLITAAELGELITSVDALGLRPAEIGILFEMPDGLSRLADLIDARQRELDIVSLVISRLKDEMETEEAVSPRDISLIERRSQLAPNIDELLKTFSLFGHLAPDIVRIVDEGQDPRYVTYQIGDVRPAAKYLRALAAAIERGL